jgi:hypothetical protein
MPDQSYATAAVGWAVVIGACSVGYLYYTRPDAKRKQQRVIRPAASKDSDPQRSRAKRTEDRPYSASDGASSNASQNTKPRPKKTKSEVPAGSSTLLPVSQKDDVKEDNSWATELANRKKGTTFTASKRIDSKQKTVKQSSANKVAAEMSNETSTTGADADDDFSPSLSPNLSATEYGVPNAGDINDMLEAPTPGPAVLRITEPERQPLPTGGHSKEYKPPKQEETKKQRQNRKKNEERKAAREDDEKARRLQLEKQLRTARESRGEPAKNGVSAPPSTNAWAKNGPQKATVPAPVNGSNGALLDTFISENAPPSSQPKMNGKATHSGWSEHGLPSEEEQMRILAESDESAWKTVSKKDKKKRKNTIDGENDGGAVQPVDQTSEVILNGVH